MDHLSLHGVSPAVKQRYQPFFIKSSRSTIPGHFSFNDVVHAELPTPPLVPSHNDEEEEEEDENMLIAQGSDGNGNGGTDEGDDGDNEASYEPGSTNGHVSWPTASPPALSFPNVPTHQPTPPPPLLVAHRAPAINHHGKAIDISYAFTVVDVALPYAEMVCYMWFATDTTRPRDADPLPSRPFDAQALRLQLHPDPQFVQFLRRLISVTHLSNTVLILALNYIRRLKLPERHRRHAHPAAFSGVRPGPGSQFIVAVVALMLANKFMDDNTYTNKSWASICGCPLEHINVVEREFLQALDNSLFLDQTKFRAWVCMLEGLSVRRWRSMHVDTRMIAAPQRRGTLPLLTRGGGNNYAPDQPSVSNERNQHQSAGYAQRTQSASPEVFPFTFVPPPLPISAANNYGTGHGYRNAQAQTQGQGPAAGRSILNRKSRTQHANEYQQMERPPSQHHWLSTVTHPTSAATSQSSYAPHIPTSQPHPLPIPSYLTVPSQHHHHIPQHHVQLQLRPATATAATTTGATKRTASEAFSPRSAVPATMPHPFDRVMHAHGLIRPRTQDGNTRRMMIRAYHQHQHQQQQVKPFNDYTGANANGHAVEAHFATMNLHGNQDQSTPSPIHSSSPYQMEEATRANAFPQLTAAYDASACLHNQLHPDDLQFYQLRQGGNRGRVLRMVAASDAERGYGYEQGMQYERPQQIYQRQQQQQQPVHYPSYPSTSSTSSHSASGSEDNHSYSLPPLSAVLPDHFQPSLSQHSASLSTDHAYRHQQQTFSSVPHANAQHSCSCSSCLATQGPSTNSSPEAEADGAHSGSGGVRYAEFANAGPPAGVVWYSQSYPQQSYGGQQRAFIQHQNANVYPYPYPYQPHPQHAATPMETSYHYSPLPPYTHAQMLPSPQGLMVPTQQYRYSRQPHQQPPRPHAPLFSMTPPSMEYNTQGCYMHQ